MDGPDLKNLVNEAALRAAGRGEDRVTMAEFSAGRIARGIVMSLEERERTAFHESGHALPGMLTPAANLVRKIAIAHRCGELRGCVAPGLAVLAGDQKEAPRRDEVLDRAAVAVLVIDPGVRQGGARPGGRLIYADVVGRGGAAVGHYGGALVAVAVLDVELAELHRLRAHRAEHSRAVPSVLRPAAPHPAQLLHVLLGGEAPSAAPIAKWLTAFSSDRWQSC